ncbi:MAG: efflux RND transporter periplasmic adaptor subunit [Candidatus Gastranaerophilales bacterium]|nr:efflux RND transporter periplasmic adaptor subunit [Candidatus Gastranaerophilales bacterium]
MKFLKIFIMLMLCITTAACGIKENTVKNGPKTIVLTDIQEQNAKIKTEPLQERAIELRITIPAQFKAQNQLIEKIYAPIDGKIEAVFAEPGQIVKKGQPVVKIKSDEIGQIQLEFLEKVMDIDASINEMKAQYELSRQSFNRESTLYKEKISSKAEYEIAYAQMKKDEANFSALKTKRNALIQVYRQRLAVYGGSLASVLNTRQIYPYVTLNAGKNGILLERKINPGEIVAKDKEMFNLADLSSIWLVGYAFEKDSPYLKAGQKVTGTLEETKDKTINGVLSYVSPILDNTTKTLEVRADISNKDNSIKPNMYAEMFVNTGIATIPAILNDAVEKYGDYFFVYVKVNPNIYEERKVTIGKKNDTYSEILSGVNLGEEVVTSGSFSLLGESIKQQEQN